jgi:organic radical activating enzyme
MNIDKSKLDFLLNESKTFCVLPWVHVTTTTTGFARTCCISESWPDKPVKLANYKSIQDLVNANPLKELRVDMLNNKMNSNCNNCYEHEKHNIESMRQHFNDSYSKVINEPLANTDIDGYIHDFKLRYYDFRLNNICNMKCRTCCSANSSLWEIEDIKQGKPRLQTIQEDVKDRFINNVLNHIEHLTEVYFAGGEPLIMEEHYTILEELIKQGRTDIKLRYNTNLSVLKYKDKNILDLWSKFDNKVYVSVSLDHYGERAEYIRNGTKWEDTIKNMGVLKEHTNVTFSVNTVLSAFNFLTLSDFYYFMMDNGWYTKYSSPFNIYMLTHPAHLDARILPLDIKAQGLERISKLITHMEDAGYNNYSLLPIKEIQQWINSKDLWIVHKDKFRSEVARLDNMRSETFLKTFPELKSMMG